MTAAPVATDPWVARHAAAIAERAEAELAALVAVSSPSGDVEAAEQAIAVASALLPSGVRSERPPCSSPGYAPDLLVRMAGTGSGRLLLLGHLDTVISHGAHRPLSEAGGRLVGSGTVDMKGGVVLSIGVLHALAEVRERFAEVLLLLVVDEEWRSAPFAHAAALAPLDACLCFEAGERTADGDDAVIVRRKAAGSIRVRATGVAAHAGAAPDDGVNALLALTEAAQIAAAHHDPHGPELLSVVPTILRAGDAINVVPASGELLCDVRAERIEAFHAVLASLPPELGGAAIEAALVREWPGMDARTASVPLLAAAAERLGRPLIGAERGGASDASHVAATGPLTVDGLGPCGGGSHHPDEWVDRASLRPRAEVALAVALAALDAG